MARDFRELQARMDPASRADNRERVRAELKRMALEQLRGVKQLTQADIAEMLDVPQSSISRLEHRADMYLSTLRSYIDAVGGKLQIQAVFPDGDTVVIDHFGDSDERALPTSFETIRDIRQAGFTGFATIADLQASQCNQVPDLPGIYLILRNNNDPVVFLARSTGGHFKGRNPTVKRSVLEEKWVEKALVLYIGKAGPGQRGTLRRRLRRFVEFGQGKPVAHYGGRLIWQLQSSRDLAICWKPAPNTVSRDVEKGLIREFEAAYNKLPFANFNH